MAWLEIDGVDVRDLPANWGTRPESVSVPLGTGFATFPVLPFSILGDTDDLARSLRRMALALEITTLFVSEPQSWRGTYQQGFWDWVLRRPERPWKRTDCFVVSVVR